MGRTRGRGGPPGEPLQSSAIPIELDGSVTLPIPCRAVVPFAAAHLGSEVLPACTIISYRVRRTLHHTLSDTVKCVNLATGQAVPEGAAVFLVYGLEATTESVKSDGLYFAQVNAGREQLLMHLHFVPSDNPSLGTSADNPSLRAAFSALDALEYGNTRVLEDMPTEELRQVLLDRALLGEGLSDAAFKEDWAAAEQNLLAFMERLKDGLSRDYIAAMSDHDVIAEAGRRAYLQRAATGVPKTHMRVSLEQFYQHREKGKLLTMAREELSMPFTWAAGNTLDVLMANMRKLQLIKTTFAVDLADIGTAEQRLADRREARIEGYSSVRRAATQAIWDNFTDEERQQRTDRMEAGRKSSVIGWWDVDHDELNEAQEECGGPVSKREIVVPPALLVRPSAEMDTVTAALQEMRKVGLEPWHVTAEMSCPLDVPLAKVPATEPAAATEPGPARLAGAEGCRVYLWDGGKLWTAEEVSNSAGRLPEHVFSVLPPVPEAQRKGWTAEEEPKIFVDSKPRVRRDKVSGEARQFRIHGCDASDYRQSDRQAALLQGLHSIGADAVAIVLANAMPPAKSLLGKDAKGADLKVGSNVRLTGLKGADVCFVSALGTIISLADGGRAQVKLTGDITSRCIGLVIPVLVTQCIDGSGWTDEFTAADGQGYQPGQPGRPHMDPYVDRLYNGGLEPVLRVAWNTSKSPRDWLWCSRTGDTSSCVGTVARPAGCGAIALLPETYRNGTAQAYHCAGPADSAGLTIIITVRGHPNAFVNALGPVERLRRIGIYLAKP